MTISTAIRWPAAATTSRAPLRATIARMIFEHAVRRVPVRVTYPDGRVLGGGSQASPEFKIFRPSAFFARLGRDAKVGFGEAYMAGDWQAGSGTDLADLLTPFAVRLATLVPAPLRKLRALADKRVPRDRENTPDGARSNIAALRPEQRPVRQLPGPDDDLLRGVVRREPGSPRSPSPESNWNSPMSGPAPPACPTAWTRDCGTTARSKASTTPSSASR